MIGVIVEIEEPKAVQDLRRTWLECESAAYGRNVPHENGDGEFLATMLDSADLGLTRIQRKVLGMIMAGMTNKQISLRLHRSIRTIEDHRYRIMKKIGAENTVDLMRKALRLGARKAA